MLDKSLQYFDFIMKMPAEKVTALPEVHLPDGYVLDFFREGDELSWARLEAAVLEFPSEEKALEYFKKNYSDPFTPQLKQRCVFVREASSGKAVSTATAWFMPSSLGNRGWLQWISTDPAEQGKGLGKSVIIKAMQLFPEVEPNSDIYLHTQTWSHTAIYLYHKIGFEAFNIDHVKVAWDNEEGYRVMHNNTEKALVELEKVFKPELIKSLRDGVLMPTERERLDWPPAADILMP
jgi:GNAT superfamily N-acetyltransferase